MLACARSTPVIRASANVLCAGPGLGPGDARRWTSPTLSSMGGLDTQTPQLVSGGRTPVGKVTCRRRGTWPCEHRGQHARWRRQPARGREASAACPGGGHLQSDIGSVPLNTWPRGSETGCGSGHRSVVREAGLRAQRWSACQPACRRSPDCSHLSLPTWITRTAVMLR